MKTIFNFFLVGFLLCAAQVNASEECDRDCQTSKILRESQMGAQRALNPWEAPTRNAVQLAVNLLCSYINQCISHSFEPKNEPSCYHEKASQALAELRQTIENEKLSLAQVNKLTCVEEGDFSLNSDDQKDPFQVWLNEVFKTVLYSKEGWETVRSKF